MSNLSLRLKYSFSVGLLGLLSACAGLPSKGHSEYEFPTQKAFVGEPKPERLYKTLGEVRSRIVTFSSLDPDRDESWLCRNYYNRAVDDLVKRAKKKGADAVIGVRSVTLLINGEIRYHKTPECSDDGMEGQVATKGIAIHYLTPTEIREREETLKRSAELRRSKLNHSIDHLIKK